MADLLALGIEQEGADGRRGHIRPGHGPDCGWSNRGYTCHGKEEVVRRKGERKQGGVGGGVGGREDKLLSHTPEHPKTSKVL